MTELGIKCPLVSYSMIILYVRDNESLAFSGQIYHPKTTFMEPWQYWLGIIRPSVQLETLSKFALKFKKKDYI